MSESARAQRGPALSARLRALVPGCTASVRACSTTCAATPRERFAADCGAGITVGIVALPLAMAFAIA